jgi:hypothetical protein
VTSQGFNDCLLIHCGLYLQAQRRPKNFVPMPIPNFYQSSV